jgi:uncharacterized repeat protein (TIGR04138 family)
MNDEDMLERIDLILEEDPRYRLEAYIFVINAVGFTVRRLGREGHVSGQELLEGIRAMAIQEFGPTVRMVFEHWGVKSTEDFGEIVFSLCDAGLLGRNDRDSIEDFIDVYNFDEVFGKPFDAGSREGH